MAGMTAHKHVDFPEEMLSKLKKESQDLGISTNELIRRKLDRPPVPEEVILIRKLRILLTKKSKGGI
ncbi:MAG: hypothetical protein PHT27_07680 [Candidatus Izemoplasmatales bacterium]|nr:hypothetical protein [Candidatus Izemoplasmatales bacterium]